MAVVFALLSGLAFVVPSAGAAIAAEGSVEVELNKLENVGDSCRLTLVFTNGLEKAIDKLTVESVLFGQEGSVERFVLLNARPLPTGKIRVQQFDIGDIGCSSIGRVVLNDVTECEGAGLDATLCLARLSPTSRIENVPFVSGIATTPEPGDSAE